jgi:hypothetical protein
MILQWEQKRSEKSPDAPRSHKPSFSPLGPPPKTPLSVINQSGYEAEISHSNLPSRTYYLETLEKIVVSRFRNTQRDVLKKGMIGFGIFCSGSASNP